MATIFRARKITNDGSGGKILRGRRRFTTVTSPYARPPNSPPPPLPLPLPPDENPNWISGVLLPATRMIVNGAGKLVSSVFGSNNSPSSSETGSTSSEDDTDDDISQESDGLRQNGTASDTNKYLENEHQEIVPNAISESKLAIEQLLMKETFTRDECVRLTSIIQSRVVERHTTVEGDDARTNELPDGTFGRTTTLPGALQSNWLTRKSNTYLGNDSLSPSPLALEGYTFNNYHTAIMEAKKWLEDKKSESCSKLDWSHRTSPSSPFLLPNVTAGDLGSPVVVAKTYMQARPPWASPSVSHVGFQTPSPIRMHLFKEETPDAVGANALSSSKLLKRNSFADGSWSMLDESRRVRFKSEEDTSLPSSSKHFNSSTLELEHKSSYASSGAEKRDAEVSGTHDSKPLSATRSVDASEDLPAQMATDGGVNTHGGPGQGTDSSAPHATNSGPTQGLEDARLTNAEGRATTSSHDSLVPDSVSPQNNDLTDQPAVIVKSKANVMQSDDLKPALRSDAETSDSHDLRMQPDTRLGEILPVKNSSQPHQVSGPIETRSIDDSRSAGGNHSKQNKVNGSRNGLNADNALPSSASSLSAGHHVEPSVRSTNEGYPKPINSSDGKLSSGGIPVVGRNRDLLSEGSVDVSNNEKEESVATGSQTSSSRYLEEVSQGGTQSKSRNPTTKSEKQPPQAKKLGRYSRRGRGRGK